MAVLTHLLVRGAALGVIAERASRYAAFVARKMPAIPDELCRAIDA
jgi:hypothetical protein